MVIDSTTLPRPYTDYALYSSHFIPLLHSISSRDSLQAKPILRKASQSTHTRKYLRVIVPRIAALVDYRTSPTPKRPRTRLELYILHLALLIDTSS